MRYLRRLAAVLVASLMLGALVATPAASADTPERFVGNAAGRALGLDVLRQSLTFGTSTAKTTSLLDPVSSAAGQLLASKSSTAAGGSSGLTRDPTAGVRCADPELPAELSAIVDLGLACSTSEATVVNGLSRAFGRGAVASLGLDASTVLSQLDALPIEDVVTTVEDTVLAPILDQLETVSPELAGTINPTVDTLTDLIRDVLQTKLLDVTLGASNSEVVSEVGRVVSTGSAEGASISLLPLTQALGLDVPLAKITVGSSKATATYDRGLGTAVPSFEAALVKVELAPLAGLLPSGLNLSVSPGQTLTILENTPLESTISVADGRTFALPDGGAGAVADGVSVHLLKGINATNAAARDGGIALQLAHSEANVTGAPAVKVPVTNTPLVAGVQQLPRTGGTPWVPIAGIGVLGLAVVSRRIAVRTR